MTALDFLKALQAHIEEKVCKRYKFQADNSTQYVNPYCVIMHLPNANFTPQGFTVPFIAVEVDDATDDAEEHTLDIRMTFAMYGGGYYKTADGEKTDIPDAFGYIDLINILELTKQALLTTYTIGGCGTIRKPIHYGTYDVEAPYPYWYGYLKFTADIPNNEFTVQDKYLTEEE